MDAVGTKFSEACGGIKESGVGGTVWEESGAIDSEGTIDYELSIERRGWEEETRGIQGTG